MLAPRLSPFLPRSDDQNFPESGSAHLPVALGRSPPLKTNSLSGICLVCYSSLVQSSILLSHSRCTVECRGAVIFRTRPLKLTDRHGELPIGHRSAMPLLRGILSRAIAYRASFRKQHLAQHKQRRKAPHDMNPRTTCYPKRKNGTQPAASSQCYKRLNSSEGRTGYNFKNLGNLYRARHLIPRRETRSII
jgi:hypothetical protein